MLIHALDGIEVNKKTVKTQGYDHQGLEMPGIYPITLPVLPAVAIHISSKTITVRLLNVCLTELKCTATGLSGSW